MFKGNLKGALKSLRQFVERGKKIIQDVKINKFVCERKKKKKKSRPGLLFLL